MAVIKRAWYYVTRKKVKSLLMFFILFGIATAIISGIAIKKATTDAREDINESMNAGFSIGINLGNNSGMGNRGLGNVPASAVKQIGELDGISTYSARMIGEVDLIDLEKVQLKKSQVQYNDMPSEYKDYSDVDGMSDSSLDNKFVSGVMTLTTGRHIEEGDKQKVLLNEEFAKQNGLKLHDKIKVKRSQIAAIPLKGDGEDGVIELEIVGLFSGSNMAQATMESELIENKIVTDLNTIKMLYGYEEDTSVYQEVKYFVDDPKALPSILQKVSQLPINWADYEITESVNDFPGLSSSLDSMDGLINKMLIGIFIVGAIILSLVLAFWVNGRIHETGVLLSLGISKFTIILQYTVELLMIAFIGFGLSYFSGQTIAQSIGDSMVEQAGEESTNEFNQSLGGMMFGADPDSTTVQKTLDRIDVSISFAEMGFVWLIGGLIILLSVSLSSIFIIRLKPKEILPKMS